MTINWFLCLSWKLRSDEIGQGAVTSFGGGPHSTCHSVFQLSCFLGGTLPRRKRSTVLVLMLLIRSCLFREYDHILFTASRCLAVISLSWACAGLYTAVSCSGLQAPDSAGETENKARYGRRLFTIRHTWTNQQRLEYSSVRYPTPDSSRVCLMGVAHVPQIRKKQGFLRNLNHTVYTHLPIRHLHPENFLIQPSLSCIWRS